MVECDPVLSVGESLVRVRVRALWRRAVRWGCLFLLSARRDVWGAAPARARRRLVSGGRGSWRMALCWPERATANAMGGRRAPPRGERRGGRLRKRSRFRPVSLCVTLLCVGGEAGFRRVRRESERAAQVCGTEVWVALKEVYH